MGRRLGSYKDMTGGSRANFLDNWKEEGFLKLWLHREPPYVRILHSFRKVETIEEKDGIKKQIRWLPWCCWEEDDYYRRRRFDKENPPTAELCPSCKLIEHLEARDDLADDDVIFSFAAGRETRNLVKVDLIGQGDTKNSWQDDLTGKTEFIIAGIPADKPEAVLLTNEKWSLGQALLDRIQKDIKMLGEDDGDPEIKPICYTFEYDKGRQQYGVARFPEAKLTDKIRELWEGSAPDAMPFVRRGNPKALLAHMKGSCKVEDVPLDDLFAASIAVWDKEEKDDPDADFDPEKIEAEAAEEKAKKTNRKPPKADAKKNGEAKEAKEEKPKRPVRPAKPKEEPKPEPKKEGIVFACESCGADWPEEEPNCPGCGCVGADVAAPEPEPKPEKPAAKAPASDGKSKKGKDIPF